MVRGIIRLFRKRQVKHLSMRLRKASSDEAESGVTNGYEGLLVCSVVGRT
jgi:hypothetical protein